MVQTTINPIELIVVDLDGTLLNSDHQMTERTEKALKAAMEQDVQIVIATGKTRISGTDIITRLGLTTPGIYLQGISIYKPDGTITHEKTLDPALARRVITFAEDRGFLVGAYSGTRILVRELQPGSEQLASLYHEPMPEAVGALQNILDEMPVNKLIIIKPDDARRITALRWQLSMQLDGQGRLVQALPDMLEVLPPGASKGAALKVILKELNIPADRVMAIGDGENDIELLQAAGLAVAVGNAVPALKEVADEVVGSNDEDGVAEAVERFVLPPESDDADESADAADDAASAEATGNAAPEPSGAAPEDENEEDDV